MDAQFGGEDQRKIFTLAEKVQLHMYMNMHAHAHVHVHVHVHVCGLGSCGSQFIHEQSRA